MNHLEGLTEHEWDLVIHTARMLSRILADPSWEAFRIYFVYSSVTCVALDVGFVLLCIHLWFISMLFYILYLNCTKHFQFMITWPVRWPWVGLVHVWWRAEAWKVTHAHTHRLLSVCTLSSLKSSHLNLFIHSLYCRTKQRILRRKRRDLWPGGTRTGR